MFADRTSPGLSPAVRLAGSALGGRRGLLGLWALAYLPRVALLGFYHDDWWSLIEAAQGTAPFSFDRLANFFSWDAGYASRPLAGLACFLVSSIAGDQAPLWQLANALQVLAAALAVRQLLLQLSPYFAPAARPTSGPADFGAVLILINPWSLGMTGWPVTTGSILSLAFFAAGAREFFTEGPTAARAGRAGAWLLASFLCYESFYLQWLVFLLLALGWRRPVRPALVIGGAAAIAQVAAIAYNRSIGSILPDTVTKQLSPRWWELWFDSVLGLPGQLGRTLPVPPAAWIALCAVILFVALIVHLHPAVNHLARRSATLLAAAGGLVFLAALIHAIAGYRITTDGVMSRTTYSLNLALALAGFALAHIGTACPRPPLCRLLAALGGAAALLLIVGLFAGVAHWAEVWRVERAVLARFPAEAARRLSPAEDAVFFIGPGYRDGLVVFGAPWDLTGAVRHLPTVAPGRRAFEQVLRCYPATALYDWHWRGGVLTQDCPGAFRHHYPVKRLQVWNHFTGAFGPAAEGFRFLARDHPEFRP